jgi:long-chain fatty acid transport protein
MNKTHTHALSIRSNASSRRRLPRRTLGALSAMGAAVTALLAATPALATNGYFAHGYGMRAQGMGGVSTAMTQDAFGGASNPASMVWAGDRLDLGVSAFSPKRNVERSGAGLATLNGTVDSDSTLFWIPELGYNRMINPDLSLGVTVYGNGGMNTNYPQGSFQCPTGPTTVAAGNALCGGGGLGVDLTQLIVAPTVAWRIDPQHSVGLSLAIGYQQFKAFGLQAFESMSSAPGSVTDRGYDSATGFGVRVGYLGKLSSSLNLGLAYASKVKMGSFDKYKGLFAGGGDFDIPANYSLGLAWSPTPDWTVAMDYQRILYSGVASVGNASSLPNPLGAANGPGFGWKDIDVVKLGLAWQASPDLTLRVGYNRGGNPVSSADVSFNILAPGVMTDHYTAGFTWALAPKDELTGALMFAPRQTVTGPSLFNGLMGPGVGGNETIGMKQMQIGLAWSRKF